MSGKRKYILWTIILTVSSSIFLWVFIYSNFPHRAPVRAKQVFNLHEVILHTQYNTTNYAQTMEGSDN